MQCRGKESRVRNVKECSVNRTLDGGHSIICFQSKQNPLGYRVVPINDLESHRQDRDVAQWLAGPTAPAEDPSLPPSIQVLRLTVAYNSSSERSDASGLHGHCTQVQQAYTHVHII